MSSLSSSTPLQSANPSTPGENVKTEIQVNNLAERTPEYVAKEVLIAHQAQLFRASEKSFNTKDVQLPDSFFEPTASELAQVLQTYAQRSERLREATMKTRKMRQAEEHQRMSQFRKVLIRLQLPDRVTLQGVFTPQTKIRHIIRFVRAALLDARNVKFHLFVVPPKRLLSNVEATLWNEGLVPAALVYIGVDSGPITSQDLLKPSLLSEITAPPEITDPSAEAPIIKDLESTAKSTDNTSDADQEKTGLQRSNRRKIPKWFKK